MRSIWMAMAAGLLMAAGATLNHAAEDEKELQGAWKLSAGEADGQALSEQALKEGKLVLKGDRYTVTLVGKGTIVGTQKVDLAKKTIDITDATGPNKGQTCLGIYELKGGEFKVCFAVPGKPRPTQFKAGPDSGQWIHVWKRVQE